MILRLWFIFLVVPFIRLWPRLFVWLEALYHRLLAERRDA